MARLNEINGEQTARVGLPGGLGANGLAVNSFGVWAVAYGDTEVMRIDPDTNTAAVVKRFPVGFSQSISADPTSVWVTHASMRPAVWCGSTPRIERLRERAHPDVRRIGRGRPGVVLRLGARRGRQRRRGITPGSWARSTPPR